MLGDKVSTGEEMFDLIARARQGPAGEALEEYLLLHVGWLTPVIEVQQWRGGQTGAGCCARG